MNAHDVVTLATSSEEAGRLSLMSSRMKGHAFPYVMTLMTMSL